MRKYSHHIEPTKELLDRVKIGDLVRINNWKKPMCVKGVSENYFVMVQNNFGETYYSVCEKKPWSGVKHNAMRGGMFHCGRDNMLFCMPDFDYDFDNTESVNRYLQMFEQGEIELSVRAAIPIWEVHIKVA